MRDLLNARQELREVEVGPIRNLWPNATWDELARYVESSWADTYGEQSRFLYSAGYLSWLFGPEGLASDMSVAAKVGHEVAGVLLYAKRRVLGPTGPVDTGIATQLSVLSHHKGMGLVKLLHLCSQREAAGRLAGTFCWLDPAVATPASSYRIFPRLEGEHLEHWGTYRLRLRVMDPRRVADAVSLRWYERPAVFALRPRRAGAGPPELVDGGNADEVTEFLNATGPAVRRLFSPEELLRYAATTDEAHGFRTCGVVLRGSGQMAGVAVAYPTELAGHERESLLFVDWLALKQGYGAARIAAALESLAREPYDACALVTLDPRLNIARGYLPTRRAIGCYCTPLRPELARTDVAQAALPPIDEK